MTVFGGLPGWFGLPVQADGGACMARSERLTGQVRQAERALGRERMFSSERGRRDAFLATIPKLFRPGTQFIETRAVLNLLHEVGYGVATMDLGDDWEAAYRKAHDANPHDRLVLIGSDQRVGHPVRGYVCTGTEGGDLAIVTTFEPRRWFSPLGRLRCGTETRLVALDGIQGRRPILPRHLGAMRDARHGSAMSRHGECAEVFLQRLLLAEVERQVRVMERAGAQRY